MNVGIELEPAIECVRDCNHSDRQAEPGTDPRLNGFCGKNFELIIVPNVSGEAARASL